MSSETVHVVQFRIGNRLPSLSSMDGHVPAFVDSFFNRVCTRVKKNGMEIWVHVKATENGSIEENFQSMVERLETPEEKLEYYERTLHGFSESDVEIMEMTRTNYHNMTEHSASIANKEWGRSAFRVDSINSTMIRLKEVGRNVVIKVPRKSMFHTKEVKHRLMDISEGDVIFGEVKCPPTNSRYRYKWYFDSIEGVLEHDYLSQFNHAFQTLTP